MARTVANAKLDTRTARAKLPTRREPYWQKVAAGCFIGYRRTGQSGSWVARMRGDDLKQHYQAIGAADDALDADGAPVLTFAAAQEKARAFFTAKARELDGHEEAAPKGYSVADALTAYFKARSARGSKGVRNDQYYADARIVPALGTVPLAKLSTPKIRKWLEELATAPRRLRTKPGDEQKMAAEADDSDAERARRASANRTFTILKAALNFAFHDGKVGDDSPWRRVKPFKGADEAKVRFLTAAECARLVAACPPDFAQIVRGALLTGCRYGELTALTVAEFSTQTGTVFIRESKSGRPRHVVLTAEGQGFFAALAADRPADARMFVRADGGAWGKSHQQRPLVEASAAAKIKPAVSFHVLRHTYASAALMAGVTLEIIAEQLGHVDTRITRRHYAHLAPGHVAAAIRAKMPDLGVTVIDHA